MLKPYIYCYVILMLEQTSNGQMMKNSTLLKEYVFKDAPKFWFLYIKAFLLKNLKIISKEHNNYTVIILRDTTRMSALLQKLSNRITVPTVDQSPVVVKVPLWNLIEYNENIVGYFSQTWIFKLHKKLQANISFEYINIYINYLYFCKIGFVEVRMFQN